MSLYAVVLQDLKRPKPVHDNVSEHKASSVKTWFAKAGVEEPECPAQNPDLSPTEHVWDELEHRLHPRRPHAPSLPDLTNALGAE